MADSCERVLVGIFLDHPLESYTVISQGFNSTDKEKLELRCLLYLKGYATAIIFNFLQLFNFVKGN
jgi:hypothetical protein